MTQKNLQFYEWRNPGMPGQLAGIRRVAEHNETWLERARKQARMIDMVYAKVSSADVREWADETNDHPDHPNAWGALFRGGGWRCVGRVKTRHADGHAREIKLWTYTGKTGMKK